MKNNKGMTEMEKQKAPLENEVTPENAFTKMIISAARVANKFGLKNFKPEQADKK